VDVFPLLEPQPPTTATSTSAAAGASRLIRITTDSIE
jgi:hypothetical protein